MIKYHLIVFVVFVSSRVCGQQGELLFKQHCANCHSIFKTVVGPPLANFENHGPWADRNKLYEWIASPPSFMLKDQYTKSLQETYGTMMQSFGTQLSHSDIDAIVDYINKAAFAGPDNPAPKNVSEPKNVSDNWGIFGAISLLLVIVAGILAYINNNLKRLADEKEQQVRVRSVPFYRNKVYITIFSMIVFAVGGYFVTKMGIGIGNQKGYEPRQPIYFSHKVHAGINQINCLYCHSDALESKMATVPSVNVCLNCHRVIQSYQKGPMMYDAEGNEINGTNEIQKLYHYASFDPLHPAKWNPEAAQSIPWVRIHNLPDMVFFSHAQHTRVGKIQCQSCHGTVTEMDQIRQFSELTMGWCVNCHRKTRINFNYNDSVGNNFYSIYKIYHDDFNVRQMDSITVEDIGGIECQKCHY